MSKRYDRKYKLTITGTSGETRIIENLRVSFEITKSLRGYPNLAKIDVYNANNDTLVLLRTKFTTLSFDAGYVGDIRLLFRGQVRNALDTRSGPDRIFTVYAGDGEQDWQNATFNKTLAANVDIGTVLKDIGATFPNTAIGDTEAVNIPADKLRGQTLSGASKDILDMLAEDYGFNWSIQDGEMIFIPKEKTNDPDEAVLITSSTGMIGSPTITEIGVDVSTLLIPKLQPNKIFKVESSANEVSLGDLFFRDVKKTQATGFYKIQEVIHKGDTHDNEWSSLSKGAFVNVG